MASSVRMALSRLDLFANLEQADLDAIAALAIERAYEDGETIFSRGDPGEGMLVVLRGRIRLSIVSADGRELILREAEEGDVIGEIAVLDGGKRTADAVALGALTAGFIGQASFARLMAARPGLQAAVVQVLCSRLRETTDQLEAIALYPLEARLARFLLWHLKRHGRTRADGASITPLTISQGAIASFVGASRPKVNRLLAAFEAEGAIDRRGALVHCNVPALRRLAQIEPQEGAAKVADAALRPAALTGIAAFALGLAFLLVDPDGAATRLREQAFDGMMMLLPPDRAEGGVIVVDIDRKSLAEKGAWPWRRALLADLVKRVMVAQPQVVGIDILLAGPDRRAPARFLEAFAAETGRRDIAAIAAELPSDDAALARAIAAGPVVLGLVLDAASTAAAPFPAPIAVTGQPAAARPSESTGVAPPLDELAEGAAAIGALSLEAGPGARVREAPIVVRGAGEVYAGFALEVFRAAQGAAAFVLENDGSAIEIGKFRIPLGQDAQFRLRLAPARSWAARTVSAADMLDGKVADNRLKDRIVLIGASAPEAGALIATAADPLTPTVELQAEAIETLRSGHIVREVPRRDLVEPLVAALLGALALVAALSLGPLAAAGVLALLVTTWVALAFGAFHLADLLFDPVGPVIPAVLAANGAALVLFARTRKLRIAIERKFGSYYSPALVKRLTANPEELRFEGELREVTALFTDVEGFTTMSERAEPRLLVAALDAYFEGLSSIVIDHGGMVDKIVGDAVHGLFNAPLDLPHHARSALDCAIAMDRFAKDFCRRDDARALGFGRTRIGFETGPVIVGDVGGLGHLDYTAHGDAVNSAARLEAINKQFGTTICLGARAAAAIAEPERLRPLGSVVLRGRRAATAVFSPWPEDATPERRSAYLEAYRAMEAGEEAALPLFEALAQAWPGDPAVSYWIGLLHGAGTGA